MTKTYYPLLKWKKGEQEALKNLQITSRNFCPIIEIVDKCSASDFFSILETCCSSPIYFDINKFGTESIEAFITYTRLNNIKAYPVLHSNTLMSNTILPPDKFAIKIPIPVDFEGPSFEEIIDKLSLYQKHHVNLILDAGHVLDSQMANSKYDSYYRIISNNIDVLSNFENIIICLTSFPEQLTIESGEDIAYKRFDILIFRKLLKVFSNSIIIEKLQYSDYGVTKNTDSEFDFSKMKYGILPKVKYTTETEYIVKKGEKDRINNIFIRSYIDISREIVNSPYYFGEQFSYGDKCIYEKANIVNAKPGNSQQWVTYCTNHHLAVLMEQLSNLVDF